MLKELFASAAAASFLAVPALAGSLSSGLAVGQMVTPFHPTHVAGPDSGTNTCPPWKYGARPAVQAWINGDNPQNVAKIVHTLGEAINNHKNAEFKAFVIVITDEKPSRFDANKYEACKKDKCTCDGVGIAVLNPKDKAVTRYRFNTSSEIKNTIIVYRNKKVTANMVNLKADKKGLKELNAAIEKATAK